MSAENQISTAFSRFSNQNYNRIKSECLKQKKLFVDDLFLPNDKSLFKRINKINGIVWKRPHEICKDPKLVCGGAESRDVNQGQLGNCWFVAALSVLASEKKIWNKVIPDYEYQEIDKKTYAGVFKFRFWQFGKWIEIVIDDLLPTINNRLIFTHSSSKNEFWSSLVEKAYAKLNGCYEHLDGGNLSEALQDFTGGICEIIRNESREYLDPEKLENLFEIMKKAYERSSLMACAINISSRWEMEKKLSCGLVKGHAYGITKIQSMSIKGNSFLSFLASKEKLQMIRLKNPWGAHEWLGPWSDNSPEWKKVPKSEREKMGLNFDDDGEFWMEFTDFLRYFNEISICRTINTSLLTIRKTWCESLVFGEWSSPDRAGGCVNYRNTFCSNPQYLFELTNNDSEKLDEILINLDQLGQRFLGKENLTIGFFVMRVEDNRKYRVHKAKPRTTSSSYINMRSVFLRTKLTSGRYVIIPSTFDPNFFGKYMLRIYSDSSINLTELKKDCPVPFLHNCNPFAKYASCVTSLTVKSAKSLINLESSGAFDSYICIKCEKQILYSKIVKNSLNPEWNLGGIFYRYDQRKPICIQLWVRNTFKDELYGSVVLDAQPNNKHVLLECSISGTQSNRGIMKMEIQSMTNITSL